MGIEVDKNNVVSLWDHIFGAADLAEYNAVSLCRIYVAKVRGWHDRLGEALEEVHEIESDPTDRAGIIICDLINEMDELLGIGEAEYGKCKTS